MVQLIGTGQTSWPIRVIGFKQYLRGNNSGVRKKLICIGLLPAGVGFGYLFYISWGIGLAVSKYFSGEKDGRPGRVKSIIISWRRYELHLHHWFLSSLAGAIIAVEGSSLVIPGLLYGFIGGLVFQGIYCYSDWYRIVKRKNITSTLERSRCY